MGVVFLFGQYNNPVLLSVFSKLKKSVNVNQRLRKLQKSNLKPQRNETLEGY